MHVGGNLRLARRRTVEDRAHPAVECQRAAALAEHHPAVVGRPVIVDEPARVRHREARLPAEAGDPLGDGPSRHDVAGHDHQERPVLGQARRPRVQGQHDAIGRYPALRRPHLGPPGRAVDPGHGRVLEDADAALDRHPPQSAHEMPGMDDRRGRLEDPGEVRRRARPPRDLRGLEPFKWRQARLLELDERVVPGTGLSRVGGRPQPAAVVVAGIDPMSVAELADLPDAVGRRLGQPRGLLDAARLRRGCRTSTTSSSRIRRCARWRRRRTRRPRRARCRARGRARPDAARSRGR